MTCRKLVEGGGFGAAFPCDLGLPEGHEGPCAAKEKPASLAERQEWEREHMDQQKPEPGLEAFQAEHTAQDYVTNPAPYPGERGFPHFPRDWQVHQRDSDGTLWSFVPIARRWMPVHQGEVDPGVLGRAPCTIMVYLSDGNHEQRVILPRPNQDEAGVVASTPGEHAEAISKVATGPERVPDQPSPSEGEGDIWAEIIEDMQERHAIGLERYGTPLQRFNGRDAMTDAYQEALDLLAYLRQASGERAIIKALYALIYEGIRNQADLAYLGPEMDDLARLLGVIPSTVDDDG